MRSTVRVSARADREATTAATWWRRNRRAVELFEVEYREALDAVARSPELPPIVSYRRGLPVRRLHLAGTGYHLYYTYDAARADALIVTLWGARRGRGPFR